MDMINIERLTVHEQKMFTINTYAAPLTCSAVAGVTTQSRDETKLKYKKKTDTKKKKDELERPEQTDKETAETNVISVCYDTRL